MQDLQKTPQNNFLLCEEKQRYGEGRKQRKGGNKKTRGARRGRKEKTQTNFVQGPQLNK